MCDKQRIYLNIRFAFSSCIARFTEYVRSPVLEASALEVKQHHSTLI